jgi:hypothetical protein
MARSAPGLRRLVEVVVLPALLPAVLSLPVPLLGGLLLAGPAFALERGRPTQRSRDAR